MVWYHPGWGCEPANRAAIGRRYPDTLRRYGRAGVQKLYYLRPGRARIMGI
jgi:hypothetical protein